jgi:thioredoxin reductase (NADPH)
VVGETSVPAALERLGALHDDGDQVALIICYESMRAMPGSELLARSRTIYPDAKRILLIDYGDQRMLDVIARGMALGHVEHYLTKPWRPRQHLLYPVVGEALVAWTRANWPGFELVRMVGDHWDPASHQLRDALNATTFRMASTTATPPRVPGCSSSSTKFPTTRWSSCPTGGC